MNDYDSDDLQQSGVQIARQDDFRSLRGLVCDVAHRSHDYRHEQLVELRCHQFLSSSRPQIALDEAHHLSSVQCGHLGSNQGNTMSGAWSSIIDSQEKPMLHNNTTIMGMNGAVELGTVELGTVFNQDPIPPEEMDRVFEW